MSDTPPPPPTAATTSPFAPDMLDPLQRFRDSLRASPTQSLWFDAAAPLPSAAQEARGQLLPRSVLLDL